MALAAPPVPSTKARDEVILFSDRVNLTTSVFSPVVHSLF